MDLTPRQKEIAHLVGAGLSNKAIAQQTGLSQGTIRKHVEEAAKRIEGERPPRIKLTTWSIRSST